MGSETDIHGRVLEKNDFASAGYQVGVNRPSGSINREAGVDRPVVTRQANHGADEFETRTAPDSASGQVRALVKVRIQLVMPIETIQRTQSEKDIDGGENDVRLGRDGMSATLLIELHVRARRGINSLQAGLDLPWRAGTKLDLPKREAKLPVSVEAARRHDLGHAALQVRA